MKKFIDVLKENQAIEALLQKKGPFVVDDTLGISLLVSTAYLKHPEPYYIVAANLYHAQKIYDFISSFIGEEHCLFFPMDEMLRVEAVSASKEMLAQRLYVLHALEEKTGCILITHVAGAVRYLPSPELFHQSYLHFAIGDAYDLNEIKEQLTKMGYQRTNKIDQSLQFAMRGDILDISSVNQDSPIRIEFFDNEVESIRYFDMATQRSIAQIEQVDILPASDFLFTEEERKQAPAKLQERLKEDVSSLSKEKQEKLLMKINDVIDRIETYQSSSLLYPYYGYLQNQHFTLLDYFPHATTILVHQKRCLSNGEMLLQEASDYFLEAHEDGQSLTHLSLYQDFSRCYLSRKNVLSTQEFVSSEHDTVFSVRSIITNGRGFQDAANLIRESISRNKKTIVALSNKLQRDAIVHVLNEEEIPYEMIAEDDFPKGKLGVTCMDLETGFELPSEGVAYLTSQELFSYRNHNSRFMNRYKEAAIIKSYEELVPGDYVVHESNGIGQFIGIQTLEVDGVHRDYLHIAYAGKDVLYVPLEQFRLIRKFIGKEGAKPKLNRLGSTEWERTKRKIKERVNDMAERLLALYAERSSVPGYAFKKDDEFQVIFESQFPFVLTKDQETSLAEIKKDMEKPTPMDRLLCGDVGFGKTEIAFRAAFKAIANGKQVGLLCPTTLLARQHYERALERFSTFGVKIAVLSRLVPETIQKKYIEKIRSGEIHFVIGTHRLLAKEVQFRDLGLLIVDEEQRFGVEQKERLKELKANVDVLTLTATPIPRTLQMSLVGIRQLSQLNSAPMNRMPIQTYVLPYKESMIQELLERELARQGQVFYLHNQVSTIYSKASKIQRMVPDARLGIVHGKMDRNDIEDTMMKFYRGELDILICTSIIETGIDIANANMIIIENADCFGLSQLYQIKGRVGRGNRIAYAYLLYRENKALTETAEKRLKAIQEFTELGSGYRIAQRDLMIRGAGDILGSEQAGFIDTVGMDMYIQLLNEVIAEKQNPQAEKEEKVQKTLTIDAYIPAKYANDGDKIALYQEIEGAKTKEEIQKLEQKVIDIYGKTPISVNRLFLKRKLDFALEQDIFSQMTETNDYIDVKMSTEFSTRDGIGLRLFEKLGSFLALIQVSFIRKEIRIRFHKRGEWLPSFLSLIEKIQQVDQETHEN